MGMLPQQSAEWQQSRNVINILLKSRLKGKNHSRKQLYIYLQEGIICVVIYPTNGGKVQVIVEVN